MNPEFDYLQLKSIGKNVFISGSVDIRRPHLVSIDHNVAIDTGFYLTTAATIGSYVHIGPYVTCVGGEKAEIIINSFVGIAAGVRFICLGDEHLGAGLVGPLVPDIYRDRIVGGRIVLEEFSSIGTNAIIFPGVTIAEGCVIGAGAVVTKDTRSWTVYVGNPARPVRVREQEKMKAFGKALTEILPN